MGTRCRIPYFALFPDTQEQNRCFPMTVMSGRDQIHELVERKAQAGDIADVAKVESGPTVSASAEVLDLTALLKRSLEGKGPRPADKPASGAAAKGKGTVTRLPATPARKPAAKKPAAKKAAAQRPAAAAKSTPAAGATRPAAKKPARRAA